MIKKALLSLCAVMVLFSNILPYVVMAEVSIIQTEVNRETIINNDTSYDNIFVDPIYQAVHDLTSEAVDNAYKSFIQNTVYPYIDEGLQKRQTEASDAITQTVKGNEELIKKSNKNAIVNEDGTIAIGNNGTSSVSGYILDKAGMTDIISEVSSEYGNFAKEYYSYAIEKEITDNKDYNFTDDIASMNYSTYEETYGNCTVLDLEDGSIWVSDFDKFKEIYLTQTNNINEQELGASNDSITLNGHFNYNDKYTTLYSDYTKADRIFTNANGETVVYYSDGNKITISNGTKEKESFSQKMQIMAKKQAGKILGKLIENQCNQVIEVTLDNVFTPIEDTLNNFCPTLGSAISRVLQRYVSKGLNLGKLMANEIKGELNLPQKDLGNSDKKFNLSTELLNAAFEGIGDDLYRNYIRGFENAFVDKAFDLLGLSDMKGSRALSGALSTWVKAQWDYIWESNTTVWTGTIDGTLKQQAIADKYGLDIQGLYNAKDHTVYSVVQIDNPGNVLTIDSSISGGQSSLEGTYSGISLEWNNNGQFIVSDKPIKNPDYTSDFNVIDNKTQIANTEMSYYALVPLTNNSDFTITLGTDVDAKFDRNAITIDGTVYSKESVGVLECCEIKFNSETDYINYKSNHEVITGYGVAKTQMTDAMVKQIDNTSTKEAAEKAKQASRKEYIKRDRDAREQMCDAVGTIAAEYAMELYNGVQDYITDISYHFGKVGGAVVRAISNQFKSFLTVNIAKMVGTYLKNAFVENGAFTSEAFKGGFDINWTQVGISVLTSLIAGDEASTMVDLATSLATGVGGFLAGPVTFEVYSKSYFMFGLNRLQSLTAIMAASGKASIAMDAEGIAFGIFDYAPTQFIPIMDNNVITHTGPIPTEAVAVACAPWVSVGSPLPSIFEPTSKTITMLVPTAPVPIVGGVPLFADAGYIFCDMIANKSKSSYVQKAFSLSTYSLAFGGIPMVPTPWSALLNIEAAEFLAFTTQTAAKGGFKGSIADLTTKAKARYHEEAGMYIVGPFKVDYIRSFSHTVLRGKVDFGAMIEMKIFDQNNQEIKSGWGIVYSEDGDFNHATKTLDKNYPYPYPKEDFYIAIAQYGNENATSLSRIQLRYKEMQVSAYTTLLAAQDFIIGYANFSVPIPVPTDATPKFSNFAIPVTIPDNSFGFYATCVTAATKYYVYHTQNIYLNKKNTTQSAWETAEYTTSSSVKTTGADYITLAAGGDTNSSFYKSFSTLLDYYEFVSPYSTTGSEFLDTATKAYNVLFDMYENQKRVPKTVEAIAAVLEVYGKGNFAKVLLGLDTVFSKGNNYAKAVKLLGVFAKNQDLKNAIYALSDVVDIYTSDKVTADKEIQVIKSLSRCSHDQDLKDAVDEFVRVYEASGYKEEVLDALARLDGRSDEEVMAYLKQKYPDKIKNDTDARNCLRNAKQMENIIRNTGTEGSIIMEVIKGCEQLRVKNTTGLTKTLVDMGKTFGLPDEQITALNVVERVTKQSEEFAKIDADPRLTQEEKEAKKKQIDQGIWNSILSGVVNVTDDEKRYLTESAYQIYRSEQNIERLDEELKKAKAEGNQDRVNRILSDMDAEYANIGKNTGKFTEAKVDYRSIANQYTEISENIRDYADTQKKINALESKENRTTDEEIALNNLKKKQNDIYIDSAKAIAGSNSAIFNEVEQDLSTINRAGNKIYNYNEEISRIKNDGNLTEIQKQEKIAKLENERADAVLNAFGSAVSNSNSLDETTKQAFANDKKLMKKALDLDSSMQQTALREVLEGMKTMSSDDAEILINNIKKCDSPENIVSITNSTIEKINQTNAKDKIKEEKTQEKTDPRLNIDGKTISFRNIDAQESELKLGSQLYDNTSYTEYDTAFNITKMQNPLSVWYMGDNEIDFTMTIAGVVWKDGHSGYEDDFDGIRTANSAGDLEKGVAGVKVTLIKAIKDPNTGLRVRGTVGRMRNGNRWIDAVTYTDEGGYYHLTEVEAGMYFVDFEYDGETYMATTYLSDKNGKSSLTSIYEGYPDLEMYSYNSKAKENKEERQEFNDKFYTVQGTDTNNKDLGLAISKDGHIKTQLHYEAENGISKLVTLDNEGHVLPEFAMHASSYEVGTTYPIDPTVTLENDGTEMQVENAYFDYRKTGEYMYHVNLGLVERSKIELSVTQDVYDVTTIVNEKEATYQYNSRGILNMFDANLKQTKEYRDTKYELFLYNADFNYRVEDYKMNDLNRLNKQGFDKTNEIERIQEIKTEAGEERVFVTYKVTLANNSVLQSATINEIAYYFDPSYKLVEEDTYEYVQGSGGIRNKELVAKQSFFILNDRQLSDTKEYKLEWDYLGMDGGYSKMVTKEGNPGLEDVIIGEADQINVFITFEVEKIDRTISLGYKNCICEITNYTSLDKNSSNKEHSLGLIDRDSNAGNISIGDYMSYEDDTDMAPALEIKLHEEDTRLVNGTVWNDQRDAFLPNGQILGDGIRSSYEETIDGVRVQLVEIIRDPDTEQELEYVWKEMYTGDNEYSYVVSNIGSNSVKRGTIDKGIVLGDSIKSGEYRFTDFVSGNYIIRFIYGDTYRTYLLDGSKNKYGEGQNDASYNGQDYKSTTYWKGENTVSEWYDLGDEILNRLKASDAKDNLDRRQVVINYAKTITNRNGEVLASFDDRDEKNYYAVGLHDELRDNTWMFADTAKLPINVEYDTEKLTGMEKPEYHIRDIDLGLEKRPETKLVLTQEITKICITLANGRIIINTEEGLIQNVNWLYQIKNEVLNNGNTYEYNKRQSMVYSYREKGVVHLFMDEEIMRGANIQITYKLTVTNDGEIDFIGQDGGMSYVYNRGRSKSSDVMVTTTANMLINYVDNSLTFREDDNPDWHLIENTQFNMGYTSTNTEAETTKYSKNMGYGEYINLMTQLFGEDNVIENLSEFNDKYAKYQETGIIEELEQGNITPIVKEKTKTGLLNTETLQNMMENGYLNSTLNIVKTKSARTNEEPITQIVVTDALSNRPLKPGESTSIDLVLTKTLSPGDADDTLSYDVISEILIYSNLAGRRDMDAVPGNQEPDKEPKEYDSDYSERILITPPFGETKPVQITLYIVIIALGCTGVYLIKRFVIGSDKRKN